MDTKKLGPWFIIGGLLVLFLVAGTASNSLSLFVNMPVRRVTEKERSGLES